MWVCMGCKNVALDLSDWSYGTICNNDHYTYRSILYTLNKILVNINLYNFARCIHHCMPQMETTHTANKASYVHLYLLVAYNYFVGLP